MHFWAIRILDGVSFGMLLFLIATGPSLIFGLMRIANLAHGSFCLLGAFVGSLLVGLLDNFGKALFPERAFFTIFAPMALVLALRPQGLFGR